MTRYIAFVELPVARMTTERAFQKGFTCCPVKPSIPLFRLGSGHAPATQDHHIQMAKITPTTGGFNPDSQGNHNLNIGTETAAAESGLPSITSGSHTRHYGTQSN